MTSAIAGNPCRMMNHGANSTGRKLETKLPGSTLFGARSIASGFAAAVSDSGVDARAVTDDEPLFGATSTAIGIVLRATYWRVSGSKWENVSAGIVSTTACPNVFVPS